MGLFTQSENRIRCGSCSTEFDLNKNQNGCPLCGFGVTPSSNRPKITPIINDVNDYNYLTIPASMKLPDGKITQIGKLESTLGLFGMINDFFSAKACLRICANIMHKHNKQYVTIQELLDISKPIFEKKDLLKFKGFPSDINNDVAVGRLVHHFIRSFVKMGLFEVKVNEKVEKTNIWNEKFENILLRPTKQGLEFSQMKNNIFDNIIESQVFTTEEKKWMIDYLKKLDQSGFKEYTTLLKVYSFLKSGKNGNSDLCNWFKSDETFVEYVKSTSRNPNDDKAFRKKLINLSQTFGSGKISLLREFGVIKNKRNDYTLVGELK